MASSNDSRVCLLHTGGTIGMQHTESGYVPDVAVLDRFLDDMPQLRHADVPTFELVRLEPLLDSADMRPDDWARIADAVLARYADFDGFVILHGTDTMTYTASALSFLLGPLDKPVILTGAQLSLNHVRSDGREHIITALILAGCHTIPEVSIYFGDRLMRGNRTQKLSTDNFVGFESGNYPPLAEVGTEIRVRKGALRRAFRGPPLALVRNPEVVAVRLYPGITARTLQRLLEPPTEAVVLETYGSGNLPTRDRALLDVVAQAVDRGVVVVNCSQCHSGSVDQSLYAAGARLAGSGVISGHDMTPEAALTKLHCLLGSGRSAAEVRQLMARDLAGEITLPD